MSRSITMKSQGVYMIETLVIGITLTFILFLTILYTKRMIQAQNKYLEAKTILDDIILSFSKQLEKQESRLVSTNNRIKDLSNRETRIFKNLEDYADELKSISDKTSRIDLNETSNKISSIENELNALKIAKDNLLAKISNIEKNGIYQKSPEPRIESAIPIRREKALDPLTDTELTVLKLLASEGEKTAPEIRTQILLSREHTARLMKKLYAEGYLERSANRIPFKYRLKEEMQKILGSPEQQN